MPVKPTYPGVYIEEIPSGVRTITGVATSIAAFVDSFKRGVLDEAVQVLSMGEFEAEFGGLDTASEASYAIQQFFQNGGAEAWVVRVASDGTGGTAAAVAASAVINDQPGGAGSQVIQVTAGRRIRGAVAINPGDWGNSLYVEVDYDTSDPATLFNLTVSEIRTEGGRRTVLRTETFRNLTMRSAPNNALETVNEASRLVQLTRDPAWPAIPTPPFRPAATGTLGEELPTAPVIPASGTAFTVDAGTGPLAGTLTYGSPAPPGYPELLPYLEAAIRAIGTTAVPEPQRSLIAGATVKLIGRGTTAAPYRYLVLAGRGGREFTHTATLTLAGAAATALHLDVTPNLQQYKLDGGLDGTVPVGGVALIGSRGAKTGMYALEDVDLFNILCVPRAADLAADSMRAVYGAAEVYCEERRAFLVVDLHDDVDDLEAMQTWLLQNDSLRHRNAAAYFPRTLVPDPLNDNRLRSLAGSGTVAGLYARTDSERGVWKAPAGTDARLRNVQGLTYRLTDPQNGVLNPLGVNCLRNFPVYGNVCWGARTLDGADQIASEWKYIPVRRFTLFLEESLYRGTKWAVFEPNDEPLWAQIRLNIGAFMQGLFRQGAFQGITPRAAYFVKCDGETTTQADIDLGIVNIVVGFAPLKPAEFVIVKIQQMAGQIQS